MAVSAYAIYELMDASDNHYWRLHWFEELVLNQRTRGPLVEARFVPFIGSDRDIAANSPDLLENKSYDFSKCKKINLSVGLLPFLHIGSILHHGRLVARPSYQRKIFDLSIEKGMTEVLSVSSKYWWANLKKEIFHVPHWEYQLSRTNRFVRCLHITVPDGRSDRITKLIIPAMELIRCYYGNSSELLQEVVTSGLAGSPNRVFDPTKTVMPGSGQIPFFQQKSGRKEDAPIVARYAFSSHALTCGQQIYLSSQTNGTRPLGGGKPEGFLPEVNLPYINERTKLIVHGKQIRSGGNQFFLVYYISSDSAPFPFETFEFSRDRSCDIVQGDDSGKPDSVESEIGRVVTVQDCPTVVVRSDRDPSRNNKKRVESFGWKSKYPDLKGKKWREVNSEMRKMKPPPIFLRDEGDIKQFSSGPCEDTSNGVTGVTFVGCPESGALPESGNESNSVSDPPTVQGEALCASFKRFKTYVRTLNVVFPQKMHCDFVYVPESGVTKTFGQPLYSIFPTEWENAPIDWSFITRNGERRTPRVAIARGVCHEHQYFYLLEIERLDRPVKTPRTYTMLLAHWNGFADISTGDLRKLLSFCAKNKGSWLKEEKPKKAKSKEKNSKEFKEVGRERFKHGSKLESVFVGRILKYLADVGLLELNDSETTDMLRIRSGRKLIAAPNDALHIELCSEIRSDASESDELVEAIPELNRISVGLGTGIQQDFDFDFSKPVERA